MMLTRTLRPLILVVILAFAACTNQDDSTANLGDALDASRPVEAGGSTTGDGGAAVPAESSSATEGTTTGSPANEAPAPDPWTIGRMGEDLVKAGRGGLGGVALLADGTAVAVGWEYDSDGLVAASMWASAGPSTWSRVDLPSPDGWKATAVDAIGDRIFVGLRSAERARVIVLSDGAVEVVDDIEAADLLRIDAFAEVSGTLYMLGHRETAGALTARAHVSVDGTSWTRAPQMEESYTSFETPSEWMVVPIGDLALSVVTVESENGILSHTTYAGLYDGAERVRGVDTRSLVFRGVAVDGERLVAVGEAPEGGPAIWESTDGVEWSILATEISGVTLERNTTLTDIATADDGWVLMAREPSGFTYFAEAPSPSRIEFALWTGFWDVDWSLEAQSVNNAVMVSVGEEIPSILTLSPGEYDIATSERGDPLVRGVPSALRSFLVQTRAGAFSITVTEESGGFLEPYRVGNHLAVWDGRAWRASTFEFGEQPSVVTGLAELDGDVYAFGVDDTTDSAPVVLRSSNGTSWEPVDTDLGSNFVARNAAATDDHILVFGGDTDLERWEAVQSSDGATWSATGGDLEDHDAVFFPSDLCVHDNEFIVTGRAFNIATNGPAAWRVANGSDWERLDIPFNGIEHLHACATTGATLHLFGADNNANTVAYSTSDFDRWERQVLRDDGTFVGEAIRVGDYIAAIAITPDSLRNETDVLVFSDDDFWTVDLKPFGVSDRLILSGIAADDAMVILLGRDDDGEYYAAGPIDDLFATDPANG